VVADSRLDTGHLEDKHPEEDTVLVDMEPDLGVDIVRGDIVPVGTVLGDIVLEGIDLEDIVRADTDQADTGRADTGQVGRPLEDGVGLAGTGRVGMHLGGRHQRGMHREHHDHRVRVSSWLSSVPSAVSCRPSKPHPQIHLSWSSSWSWNHCASCDDRHASCDHGHHHNRGSVPGTW